MNRDTVIGIVGATILVLAMVGVFYYERGVAQEAGIGAGDDGAGGTTNTTLPSITGSVALGQTDSQLVNVTSSTATNVTFTLTWSGSTAQRQNTLKLTVAPPTGSGITEGAVSDPSSSGEITVTVAVPAGADPMGEWKADVEFVSSGSGLPGGVSPPGTTDSSVSYTLDVTLR